MFFANIQESWEGTDASPLDRPRAGRVVVGRACLVTTPWEKVTVTVLRPGSASMLVVREVREQAVPTGTLPHVVAAQEGLRALMARQAEDSFLLDERRQRHVLSDVAAS